MMGLFRVGMAIGTLGAVSPYSRQSRDTRVIMREARKQTALLAEIADPGKAERIRLAQKVELENLQKRAASERENCRPGNQVAFRVVALLLGLLILMVSIMGTVEAAMSDSIGGAIVGALFTISIVILLFRATPHKTEGVPASPEPTQ
jgi:hypothetical protein